ncbi:unnamed protein product [Euphydryas editha]|uniref:Uncharacterized protein n=1 Tax=Euphydryas editha TaxID=104508 RepID=A0AAU9U3I9_EUPED|nr:unnamed protein product [Euphydryas editha]
MLSVLTGCVGQPPPAPAGGHERPSAGHVSGSALHARSRRPPRRTERNDATQPPRAIDARPPHAPSDTVPPRLVSRPRTPRTLPTDVFPSFHGARALPSFPSDR